MDYKGISAGVLASALDVQRSNISHILNGRNKPGANFIEKFLLTYPDLNARWLLTGKGQMTYENIQENSTIPSNNPDIFSNVNVKKTVNSPKKSESKEHKIQIADDKLDDEKVVEKVILLYSDGSFKSYNPENKQLR